VLVVVSQYAMACFVWSQWHARSLQKLHSVLFVDSGAMSWSMATASRQGDALPRYLIAPDHPSCCNVLSHIQDRPMKCMHGFHINSVRPSCEVGRIFGLVGGWHEARFSPLMFLGPFPHHTIGFSTCPASTLIPHCCSPNPHAPAYHSSAHVSWCALACHSRTISMAAPGPEWMLWAKKLRDEHVNLVESLETLSSTVAKAPLPVQITDLEASQLALQQEVNSLRETLAAAELQREQHSRIADERIAALEQQVRTAARLRDQNAKDNNEQIKRLEEDVAALRRRAPSASKLRVTSAGTRHTSQLNGEYLVDL